MTKWAPAKRDVLDALATEILHNYGRGRAIVAIDGDVAAESGAFADDLATSLRAAGHAAFAAHLDGFQRPSSEQTRHPATPDEHDYHHRYDYDTLRRVLIDPFKMGGSTGFVLAAFDAHRDAPIEPKWTTAPRDALLLVDGPFALRPELRGAWNNTIRLDSGEPAHNAAYRAAFDVRANATILVDNRDPEHPRRLFADAC
ncbi:hypothetical protein HQQ80_07465 [Microbacteriaceae bacterium VKM Ac-2855]|nr:hypothetical protein [Microbacteriaceae bacterium VKM Ac-2855]